MVASFGFIGCDINMTAMIWPQPTYSPAVLPRKCMTTRVHGQVSQRLLHLSHHHMILLTVTLGTHINFVFVSLLSKNNYY